MLKIALKYKAWYRLRTKENYQTELFKTIIVDNNEKEQFDNLILKLLIDPKKIYMIQKSEYTFPDKLEPQSIIHGAFSIPIKLIWVVYFFNDLDWTTIQISR